METDLGRFERLCTRWALFCPLSAKKIGDIPAKKGAPGSSDEVRSWFQSVLKETPDLQTLFVFGVGFGEVYEAARGWLAADARHALVFLEDDLSQIHALFTSPIADDLLHDPQVWLYALEEGIETHGFDHFLLQFSLNEPYRIKASEAYALSKQEEFSRLSGRMMFTLHLQKAEALEYSKGALIIYDNFYRNLLNLHRAYSGEKLFGQFKGVPAIVCGAGPSLAKNGHLLKELKDKALILAGGSALNALNALGIQPHLGVGIDPNPGHVTRLIMNEAFETPFIYRSRIYHDALKFVHGDRIVIPGNSGYKTSKWFEKQLEEETPSIEEGCNVVNFSLSIAEALGCDPIICVGVDLAFTDQKSYPDGIPLHALHGTQREFQAKGYHEELLTKPDIYGRPTITLWKWVAESFWFSMFRVNHPATEIINATEGGIGFPLIPNLPLQSVIDQKLTKEYDIEGMLHEKIQGLVSPRHISNTQVRALMQRFADKLDEAENMLTDIEECYFARKQYVEGTGFTGLPEEDGLKELLERFHNSDGYLYLLDVFDHCFTHLHARESFRMETEKYRRSLQENALREIERERARMRFLHYIVRENSHLLKNIASNGRSEMPLPDPVLKPLSHAEPNTIVRSFASGAIHSIRRNNQGVRDGMQEYFYEDGSIKSRIPYKLGKLHGTVRLFHPNGLREREISFKEGARDGFEHLWSEEGLMLIEAEYKLGKPVGHSKQWHANGQLAKEVLYDDESRMISMQEWADSGSPKKSDKEDYFDHLNKETALLTDNLQGLFQHLQIVLPQLVKNVDMAKDVDELQSQIQQLQVLQEALKREAGDDPDNPKEALWRSQQSQDIVQKELKLFTDQMKEGVRLIEENLKDLLKRFLKE